MQFANSISSLSFYHVHCEVVASVGSVAEEVVYTELSRSTESLLSFITHHICLVVILEYTAATINHIMKYLVTTAMCMVWYVFSVSKVVQPIIHGP